MNCRRAFEVEQQPNGTGVIAARTLILVMMKANTHWGKPGRVSDQRREGAWSSGSIGAPFSQLSLKGSLNQLGIFENYVRL
jgi:hypothetical protein